MGERLPVPFNLDGTGWERLCLRMLRGHYQADLIEVPAKVGGDKGLDAFTRSGIAYQCYAPEEPLSAEQRYLKLRDKMTGDIGKFIDNLSEISTLLGPVKISTWVLLTPQADDRRLVAHAMSTLTPRLREAALPYCTDDITAVVHTHQDYAGAYVSLVEQRMAELVLPQPGPPDFNAVESDDVATMRAKLEKVEGLEVAAFLQLLLGYFLAGRDHRAHIADHFTELDADLNERLLALERRLEVEYRLTGEAPQRVLAQVIAEAEERVKETLPSLRETQRQALVYAQVAEWLMRCPLDFVVTAGA
jgi:hypothetical protein